MPTPAQTLLAAYQSSGPSAIVSNPVTSALGALNTAITTCYAAIPGVVVLLPADVTAIQAALTSLQAARAALLAHTNLLAGLTLPSGAGIPYLQGVIGVAGALDGLCAGYYGSSATVIPTIITALGSGANIAATTAYVNGIVIALNMGTTTAAAVLTALSTYTGTLNGYVSANTAAYAAAQANIATASGFIALAGDANNKNPALIAYVAQIMSAPTIATLKSIF